MNQENRTQRRTEAAMRLEAIIRTATDGIIVINEEGLIEEINPAASTLFGYEPDELAGRKVNLLMPLPHRRDHDHYLENYYRTGKGKIIGSGREVSGRRKDGSEFPFRLSISEVRIGSRRVFTGIVHDLTEQKQVEHALREEKEKAQTYFDLANMINVVLDPEGCVLELNRKAADFIGQTEAAAQGKNWFRLILPPEEEQLVSQSFREMMRGELPLIDTYENEVRLPDGSTGSFVWHNNLIRDRRGQAIALITSGVDITERRQAERALEHEKKRVQQLNADLEARVEARTEELAEAINQLLAINRQLAHQIQERKAAEAALRKSEQELRDAYEREKELSELKSRFVSMASHEFRTPLSTILSSADIIEEYREGGQQPRRERHTKRIKSAVANLTGILNDFLSLSRLEEGRMQPNPVEFDLRDFCHAVIDELQGLLKPGQRIVTQLPDPPVRLRLDKKFLKNVMFNLLSNAIKYSEPEQPIECQVAVEGGTLIIEVTDHGIGIPEEEQQHLFTRFFRAHNVENIQGTGLGLNIVKRYLELMSGEISFTSVLGEGSTFTVRIALPEPEDQRQA